VVNALAIQPADQKIVLGGYNYVSGSGVNYPFCLVRYNTDGTLDSTFGNGGVVTTVINKNHGDSINSVLIQPNGQIVAGGYDWYYNSKTQSSQIIFALARYNTNGSLDKSFGSGGKVTTTFPASDGSAQINTILLRSDGEIVAVGSAVASSTDPSEALALYTSSGALDTTFGSNGTVVDSSLNSSNSVPNPQGGTTTVYKYFSPSGAALESDNSILVAGTYVTKTLVTTGSGSKTWTTNEQDVALVHYLANGSLDSSFGTGGIVVTPITPTGVTTSNAGGSSVLVQPNGAILEGGTATGPNGYADPLVARFNASGTPDTTFGGGAGYTLVDLGGQSGISAIALQPNSQIVAAGRLATASSTHEFATIRLNADGSLDTTFGTNGAATTQVLYDEYGATVMGLETINSQTMIVAADTAYTSSTGSEEIAMVRYTPSGTLDSGGASPESAALSNPTSGTTTSPGGSTPGGTHAIATTGGMVGGPVGSNSSVGTMVPVAGLVPQVLDSPDFFDTLLPGRRRR
jgi:uncharacterized delta-60 repeat protein